MATHDHFRIDPTRLLLVTVVVQLDPADKDNQVVVHHGPIPRAAARRFLEAAISVLDNADLIESPKSE